MGGGALKSHREFNAQMTDSSSAAGCASLWSREGQSWFLIAVCVCVCGSFEDRYLWNLLSQKDHVLDPIFYMGILQVAGAGLFLKPNILSLLPVPGWSWGVSLTEGKNKLPFHSNLPNQISLPLLPSTSPLLKSNVVDWSVRIYAEVLLTLKVFSLALSWCCRLSLIPVACTFWPNYPKPGLHLLTPRFCRAHQTGGDLWSQLTALTDTGQKGKVRAWTFLFLLF